MKRIRNSIVYIPLARNGANAYTLTMIRLLEKDYLVSGELYSFTNLLSIIRTKAVFLNWIEDSLDKITKHRILLYKLLGSKIVWVMHNKSSHDPNKDTKGNINWLKRVSTDIIIHSKGSITELQDKYVKKAFYLPHVMYKDSFSRKLPNELRRRYGIDEHDFVFTFFGLIRPCKGIEELISAFGQVKGDDAKLIIVGRSENECKEYSDSIMSLTEVDRRIVFDNVEIPREVLNALIFMSNVIVLPYHTASYLNSGAMIHSMSLGRTVIAPRFAMADDYALKGLVYLFEEDLCDVMNLAYIQKEKTVKMGNDAKKHMNTDNSIAVVGEGLSQLLNR